MKMIEGGVCAAKGFKAGAIHCGLKKSQNKKDLAIIVSEHSCHAAAVYTKNKVKAAPLYLNREHLSNGTATAIIVNSGNANACAPDEVETTKREADAAAKFLGIDVEEVLVASTGVIGKRLNVECIEETIGDMSLSSEASLDAAMAIMTTDTKVKMIAVTFELSGKVCHLGGICKGSGMIHPNMGTMLAFLTTDCAISSDMLSKALKEDVKKTFNRVTVDGDTSTNDMCIILANGMAQNSYIDTEDADYKVFAAALHKVNLELAKKIAGDGEGAGKLMTCTVTGAKNEEDAEILAKSICSSSLVKAAIFGADANWGRVLCAMGYSGANFHTDEVSIEFLSSVGKIPVCVNGKGIAFDEEKAKKVLSSDEVEIFVTLKEGTGTVSCWGCDLTYDYVKINGDYRT